jgi:4-carboxymuconolactone decarboxylase
MDLVGDPLYSAVWADQRLRPRDRSIATVAALTVLYRPDELPVHLRLVGAPFISARQYLFH